MRNISDIIEQYLKGSLQDSKEGTIEIQRNDLAEQFSCVPSQINYVIQTRFTLEKGYLVESKRGGGGYIRIQRIELPQHTELHHHLHHSIGSHIDQTAAEGLIYQLEESGFLSKREACLMRGAISRECLNLKLPYRDELRSRVMKAMLLSLLGK
ncbi:CtsR family transcriptional regulator [Paenibacillus sp. F411]|uniref:Transcriptional regulator CtsR n=1 Tax=Paenibacillus algicola TaxID=2565926 RepID=A0A4P8XQ86_9BACL|nr:MULTISPECIES: CtsR family transcriptional regulator [Paenibacillus]MBO2945853.1 CtsR family transcriptional regulator [Paenibacillus sp. F411]QCT04475.1 transcriptional repressor CtsR [Paenibacillus algicola]